MDPSLIMALRREGHLHFQGRPPALDVLDDFRGGVRPIRAHEQSVIPISVDDGDRPRHITPRRVRPGLLCLRAVDPRVHSHDLIRGNVAEQGLFQKVDALRQTRQGPRRVGRQDRRPEKGWLVLQVLVLHSHAERRVVLREDCWRGELEAGSCYAFVPPMGATWRQLLEELGVGARDVVERRRGVGLAASSLMAVALRLERQDAAL
mmetsp:Transcript_15701/g.41345  ORF Transcript_15701/g.41345 Transcript_15701/m.41345 type:complete len:206 (+) Transcript_15701:428-1045(+)